MKKNPCYIGEEQRQAGRVLQGARGRLEEGESGRCLGGIVVRGNEGGGGEG